MRFLEAKGMLLGVAAGWFAATAAAAELRPGSPDYAERYQPIVDRQMFGPLPAGFDPTVPPSEAKATGRAADAQLTQEEQQLKSSIHFSMINTTPDGAVAVGFTDNGDAKNPVHYYLKVGEVRNGWKVLEADPLAATMTIEKNGVQVALSIGGNSASDAGATRGAAARGGRGGGSARPRPTVAGGLRVGGQRSDAAVAGSASGLRERRRLRQEREQQERAEAAERQAQREAEAAERQAQKDAEAAARAQEQAEDRERLRQQMLDLKAEIRRSQEQQKAQESPEGSEEESAE